MKKRIYISFVIAILVIGAGLGHVAASLYSTEKTTSYHDLASYNSQSRTSVLNGSPQTPVIKSTSTKAFNLQKVFGSNLAAKSESQKLILMYQSLSELPQQAVSSLIEEVDSLENVTPEDKALWLVMLISRMAETSPELSIELVNNLTSENLKARGLPLDKNFVMKTIFTIWAKHSPQQALQHLLTDTQYDADYLTLIFRHWAAKSFEQALRAAKALQEHTLESYYGMVEGSYQASHFQQLIPFIQAQQSDELSKKLFRQWTFFDALSAAQWLADNTKVDEAQELKEAMFSGLVREDFNYAIEWYFANTNDSFTRPAFAGSNFYMFIRPQQFAQVIDWLLLQDFSVFGHNSWVHMIEHDVARNTLKYDIDLVKRYAAQIQDNRRRNELNLSIYSALAKQDPTSAKAFIVELGLANNAEFLKIIEAIDFRLNTPCMGFCY